MWLTLKHIYFGVNVCSAPYTHAHHSFYLISGAHVIHTISHKYHILVLSICTHSSSGSSSSSSFLCMHVHVCVHLWVWMRLWEGASEEKGSCGMKLKAFDTVQICRTPTTEERQNKSAEKSDNEIMKGRQGGERWERRRRTAGRNWR